MKAAVYYEPNTPLRIEDIEIDDPLPGEVLVRTRASGVCDLLPLRLDAAA